MMLTDSDFARAALLLGCEPAMIRAVAAVESAGDGCLPDGRPKILFEAHIFSRLTGHAFDVSHPDISSPTWNKDLYKGGAAEYERLEAASRLNEDAAQRATSWGKFQLMGFNFLKCGYTTLADFVAAMRKSESEHLTAFCNFVRSMGLDDDLRRGDLIGFARGFNGPGFALNHYDTRLASALANFRSIDTVNA